MTWLHSFAKNAPIQPVPPPELSWPNPNLPHEQLVTALDDEFEKLAQWRHAQNRAFQLALCRIKLCAFLHRVSAAITYPFASNNHFSWCPYKNWANNFNHRHSLPKVQ